MQRHGIFVWGQNTWERTKQMWVTLGHRFEMSYMYLFSYTGVNAMNTC
jgi:ribulose-5-phosphate 4-epimerase/fuculose-1-phosphate aldolase